VFHYPEEYKGDFKRLSRNEKHTYRRFKTRKLKAEFEIKVFGKVTTGFFKTKAVKTLILAAVGGNRHKF